MTEKEDMNQESDAANPDAVASRRRLLLGAGLLATATGMGAAWWLSHGAAAAVAEPVPGFWGWQWPRPEGGQLVLKTFQSQPLLINFWATWCAPCVEELPLINDFYKKNRTNGFQVVGIAVDQAPAVQAFLTQTPLDFPLGIAGLSGAEVARALGDLSGGLPFSLVLDRQGQVVLRKSGRLSEADLAALLGLK